MTIHEHICNTFPKPGVYLSFCKEFPAWILNIQREATESDLQENSYLENIGDILWLTRIEIRYCPFCGEQLPGLDRAKLPHYGEFQHHDFSRWG